jgi:DNA-binding NarL/FixJ family response regulator
MSKRVFPPALAIARHSARLRARILAMLKNGQSQHKIARKLKVSLGTVGYHVARLRGDGIYKG